MRPPRSRLGPVPAGAALVGLLVAAMVVATCGPPEAVPHASPDARATRDAPPTSFNPRDPALRATEEAVIRERQPLPGETPEEYRKRFGIVTMCDQTRGQVVKTPQGHTVQLAPDECVSGIILAEGGGGRFLAIQKGDTKVGHITADGRVVAEELVIEPEDDRQIAEMLAAERAAQQDRETE